MTYSPPANLSPEDQQLEADLVETYRGIIRALRDRLGAAETAEQLSGWRWRSEALLREARVSLAQLKGEAHHD